MPNAPIKITDTTEQNQAVLVKTVVLTLARLLGEAAAQEWGASLDEPNQDIRHDQFE